MKRLLIALAAAVAVSTASAIVTDTQLFEDNFSDFIAEGDDESELAEYESAPSITVPYPCGDFGSKYLLLDTGDATLWRTNTAVGNVYFDMALQFNPSASAPELDTENDPTKILLYQNTESNLVILAGTSSSDRTAKEYVTATTVLPGTWARVTVSSELGENGYAFKVYIDGVLQTADGVSSFPSLTPDTTIEKVGFSGSGALDNFVARTTDPNYNGGAVARIDTVGNRDDCEMYSAYSEALADALATVSQDASVTITRSNDTTSNGSESSPYRIEDAACLKVLQDAVLANPAARSLHYVQTQNIDMAGVAGFYGIGWYGSSTAYLSLPDGVSVTMDTKKNVPKSTTSIPFAGVYDGAGYTISNVTLVRHNYGGVFNLVSGTIKNLTVQNLGFNDVETASADNGELEWGCGIVGNAQSNAVLANLTAEMSAQDGFWGNNANHNIAGISVRAQDNATITGCVNNVAIASASKRLGGIIAFTGSTAAGDTVTIIDCVNNGDLTSSDGTRGVGGILSSPETGSGANTVIKGCSNFGTLTAGENGFTGCIVGSLGVNTNSSYTDAGGNTFLASGNMLGTRGTNTRAIEGLAFALPTTISETDYLTTVAQEDLAAGNTYLLLADVAASETPVFTLAAVGDTIAFNTNGYAFAGTVAAAGDMVDAIPSTLDAVITYTATEAPTVATITENAVTTPYRTLQDAIAAAVAGETKTVNLVGAATGAVNIPAGITVAVAEGSSLSDVSSLAGSGVLYAASPAALQIVNAKSGLFSASDWEGVVSLANLDISAAIDLTRFGNANSVVRFNNAGCAFTTGSTTAHAIKALEIGPNGLDLIGNYSSGTFTFPCVLTGTGNLKIAAKNSQYGSDLKVAKFTGDVSGFTGSISFDADANCAVYFGEATGNGNCISVAAGSAVTVAAGKTWTAPGGFVVNGSMTVNGTLDAGSEKLYGSGTITFNAATSLVVANTWTGTYNANFKAANNAIVYIPVNASATTVINGVNGEFGGYPKFGSGAPTVAGPVTLNANWTVANGWTGTDYTTTFAKLSGTGDLTVDGTTSGTDPIYYTITELDNYTGTIGGARGAFTIGKVNVTDQPTNGARVVKTAIGANGSINDNVPLYVGGTDTQKTLTYVADGAEGAGLYYVVAPSPSGFDGGDGATFNIPAETQSALETKLPSGKTLADVADAASGMTYAQAYALGLLNETTGDVEDLKATIEVVDGKVKVSLDDATAGAAYTVTLKVYEKASLSAEWPATPTTTYALGNEGEGFTPGSATAGFYKVEVSISNK